MRFIKKSMKEELAMDQIVMGNLIKQYMLNGPVKGGQEFFDHLMFTASEVIDNSTDLKLFLKQSKRVL